MVSRYIVMMGETDPAKEMQQLAEFEQIEPAMDFVEFYRRKYPGRSFQIRGVSYNRTNLRAGSMISAWEPIPEELREMEAQNFLAWLLPEEN